MSEAEAGANKQPDPMEKFRELRDAYLEIWSKNLIDAVNTEGYAQASGAALDSYLSASAPYKEAAEQAMLRTLQQLNMPTSVDFAGLAGRFTNIEMQLDDMGAKLDRIEKLVFGSQPVTPAEPKETTASTAKTASVQQSAKMPAQAPKQARTPRAAKKTAPKKQSVLRARGTAKRTATAKPLRRNARKGTK
jgi:hypothetical protein